MSRLVISIIIIVDLNPFKGERFNTTNHLDMTTHCTILRTYSDNHYYGTLLLLLNSQLQFLLCSFQSVVCIVLFFIKSHFHSLNNLRVFRK